MSSGPLAALLAKNRPLVLDGAIGTELERRGADSGLPLWSARALLDAPDVLMHIHRDYLEAGADIITTDTFRTTRRTFKRAGMKDRSAELTRRAVDLVHAARAFYPQRTILVAGSLGPLEDCYRPDLVPPESALQEEHAEHAGRLADAGVDILLLETFGTIREARYACAAAMATGKEVVVSFLCTAQGTLYSGETLKDAVAAIFPLNPTGYSLNCVPARSMRIPLAELKRVLSEHQIQAGPCIAVYGNVGRSGEELSDTLVLDVGPEEYARLAREWVQQGAQIVGGCCGTTPEHIAAISQALT